MHALLPYAIGACAALATLLGGTIVLRLRDRLSLVTALSAGIVLGVALLDLMPEALHLAAAEHDARYVLSAVAAGLGFYLALDRLLPAMLAQGDDVRRRVAPAMLVLHSVIDGTGIGLAFQLSSVAGWSVAAAVLSHDLADGANVVGLSLAPGGERTARRWLMLNTLAPLLGVVIGQRVAISDAVLAPVLAALSGVFLYVGAAELLPRSYRLDRRPSTTLASLAGFALVYVSVQLHA